VSRACRDAMRPAKSFAISKV